MRIRIATFNLENLTDDQRSSARFSVLRPQLSRLHADVLCLQEIDAQHIANSSRRHLLALDKLLEGTDYEHFHRASTSGSMPSVPRDRHNLVTLSRWPITETIQYHHDVVAPPIYDRITDDPDAGNAPITWDRPVLHAQLALPFRKPMHVFNLHLKAPLAANIDGQKIGPFSWATSSGWAEGYFISAIKRAGQAFEVRTIVDRLLDADKHALVAVCGDFNAEAMDPAMRILVSAVSDTGNTALAERELSAAETSVCSARRYTVKHAGSAHMLDHILATPALGVGLVSCEIHNRGLKDEVYDAQDGAPPLGSFHSPVAAEYEL